MNKILIVLTLLLSGCGNCRLNLDSHSCPEPGHGKCYLCDDPKYHGLNNLKINRMDAEYYYFLTHSRNGWRKIDF